MGLYVQRHKCSIWVPSNLPFGFVPLTKFCCPLHGIMILGIPFGFTSFIFSFFQKVLNEDVKHVDMFLRLWDVHVVFGILLSQP